MKKAVFLFLFLGAGVLGFSQRYAIIDTKYILDKLSDYKDAQKQLDDIAAGWQKEIDAQQQELDRMYKTLRPSR
jgi:outer membrane protein